MCSFRGSNLAGLDLELDFGKPMEVTHYRGKHILDATPGNICVPHAARYTYYDKPLKLPAKEGTAGVCVPRHCSYAELARGLPVENWIRHATHTSNDVVAGQSRCPSDTTLDEFRAFGNLRSGVTLQWANVLGQLVIPSVDLNKKGMSNPCCRFPFPLLPSYCGDTQIRRYMADMVDRDLRTHLAVMPRGWARY
jgi:hypothetical protein